MSTGCVLDPNPFGFTSHSDYHIEIRSEDTLENATFCLPLPERGGVPMVGSVRLTPDNYSTLNYSVEIFRLSPEEVRNAGFPVRQETPWYLKIHSDRVVPSATEKTIYRIEIDNITWLTSPALFVDTINPEKNESVFLPKPVLSGPPPRGSDLRDSRWVTYHKITVKRKIPIFAEYSTSESNHVEVYTSIYGSNAWREHDDSGGYNYYQDSVSWYHKGDSRGWQEPEGELIAANGVYPNLSHQVWQKALNVTPS